MDRPILAAMLSIDGKNLTSEEKSFFEKSNPLGVTLFSRNIENKIQIKNLCKEIKETIGRDDVLIAVDQEGGRVRRLAEPEFSPYEAQITLGKIAEKYDEKTAERIIKIHASLISNDLQLCGINWNYAPCIDIAYPETSAVLKSRCFGSDEKRVAAYGKIMVDEYCSNGIIPCIKHIPGHGRANVDPHLELPVLNIPLSELEKDFYPFKQLSYAPAGMTAHIIVSAVDDKNPITQSKKAIQELIRGLIGFRGFLISDAIDMHALKGSLPDRGKNAINAGCDAVCYCGGQLSVMKELAKSCGFLTDNSMIRFAKMQNILKNTTQSSDYPLLSAEYNEILGHIEKYRDDYDATEILNKIIKQQVEK